MSTSNYYSIGIDAHKRFYEVRVLHPNGETVWKGRINSDGYDTFADVAAKCDDPEGRYVKDLIRQRAVWKGLPHFGRRMIRREGTQGTPG